MPISINQWGAAIALCGARRYAAIIKKTILKYSNLKALTILLFFYSTIFFYFFMLPLECQQSTSSGQNITTDSLKYYPSISCYLCIRSIPWFLGIFRRLKSVHSRLQSDLGWSPWWCKKEWCMRVFSRKFNFKSDW